MKQIWENAWEYCVCRERGIQQSTLLWRIPAQAHNAQPSVPSMKRLPVAQIGVVVGTSSLAQCGLRRNELVSNPYWASELMAASMKIDASMQIVLSFRFVFF